MRGSFINRLIRGASNIAMHVIAWREMREASAERLTERVVQILEDSLTPAGIHQWLRAHNRMLDGRAPMDLIDEEETARVEEAARAFADGAYL